MIVFFVLATTDDFIILRYGLFAKPAYATLFQSYNIYYPSLRCVGIAHYFHQSYDSSLGICILDFCHIQMTEQVLYNGAEVPNTVVLGLIYGTEQRLMA